MGLSGNRNFYLYSAQRALSSMGYMIYMITIPAYSLVASNSIVFTGLTLFVEYGIYALTFSFGPIVDRVGDKRRITEFGMIMIAASALILGTLMRSNIFHPALFLLMVGVMAVGWDILWTANWVLTPLIVDQKDLMSANGYISAITYSHSGAGLFIGGLLLVVVGAYGAMLIYGASMLCAALLNSLLPKLSVGPVKRLKEGLSGGWLYSFRNNRELLLLSLLILPFFSFFSTVPSLASTDIFAVKSAFHYSLMFSLYSLGGMAAGILIGRLKPRRTGFLILATYCLSGVFLFLSVQLRSFIPLDAVAWIMFGLLFEFRDPLYETYLQSVTDKEMLGRVASNLYTFRGISATAGTLVIPVLVSFTGGYSIFSYSALVIVIFSASVLLLFPGLRSIGSGEAAIQT